MGSNQGAEGIQSTVTIPRCRKYTLTLRTQYTFYTVTLLEVLVIVAALTHPTLPLPRVFEPVTHLNAHKLRPATMFYAGTVLMCAGTLLRAVCYRHMGRFFTFDLAVKSDHQLITTGPYSFVRHPSYTGAITFFIGTIMVQLGTGSWLAESGVWKTPIGWAVALVCLVQSVGLCLFLLARAPKEDEVLREEFKEQWVEWSKQTPYRLVPLVY